MIMSARPNSWKRRWGGTHANSFSGCGCTRSSLASRSKLVGNSESLAISSQRSSCQAHKGGTARNITATWDPCAAR